MKTFATYTVPENVTEMQAQYGDPGSRRCESAIIKLPQAIGHVREIKCNPEAAHGLVAFFRAVHTAGHWDVLETIEGAHINQSHYGFPPRRTALAYGAGIMLNRKANPNGGINPSTTGPGAFRNDHPVVKIAEDHGLTWGGRLRPPAPSLFELGQV